MSAGTGLTHSEFNPSETKGAHFLQIWLLPSKKDVQPSYEQKYFSSAEKRNQLKLLVSPDGRFDSIAINSDALVYGTLLDYQQNLEFKLAEGRVAYLHLAKGTVKVNGETLNAGDGVTVADESDIFITADASSEFLVFDLPK
jgi:redox-sensitive bicupin YhaK (pirin superfamily)